MDTLLMAVQVVLEICGESAVETLELLLRMFLFVVLRKVLFGREGFWTQGALERWGWLDT